MNIDINLVEELKNVILTSYDEATKLDKNIRNKELNDIVTDVDMYMETKIIEKLENGFQNIQFIQKKKEKLLEIVIMYGLSIQLMEQ